MSVNALHDIFKEPTCIVGIGNYYRCDDAVGLHIVDALKKVLFSRDVIIINAEDIIESYCFTIAESNCKNVLIIDAIAANAEEGTIVFGKLSDCIQTCGDVSTHKLGLHVVAKMLEANNKNVYLLGIVIKNNSYGQVLSPIIQEKIPLVVSMVQASIYCNKECVYEH